MDDEQRAADIDAMQAAYARTLYSLRESRKAMLKPYAVDDEASLLEKIRCGDVDEHPAYEHYLGGLIIDQARTRVREQLMRQFSGAALDDGAEAGVHAQLHGQIEACYAHRLSEPVRLAQDALLVFFDSGLMVEARYFSVDEYAISWCWGEAQLRIDTAPIHPGCGSFPHHLHDDSGQLRADSVTRPGAPCWSNFSSLIDALLLDPLLEPEDGPMQ
ncbi:MAG: hypothetical protein JWR40_2298 [Massilia sp.]|jgi:hypothetical protein|nr:hypothetical protein [Massilia sp.]MDB5951939.1 hypothetical protein [Massilia sp.]